VQSRKEEVHAEAWEEDEGDVVRGRKEVSPRVSVLEKGVASKKLRVDPYAARLTGVYYLSIIEY